MRRLHLTVLACSAFAAACSADGTGAADGSPAPSIDAALPGGRAIVAGERVGPLALGMTWAEARAALGEPPADPVVLVRLGHVRWPAAGIEAVLTSPDESSLGDASIVIGVAATAPSDFTGPVRPGMERAAIEAALGVAPEAYGGRSYYPGGLAVEYEEGGGVAAKVAVVAAYTLAPEPPPMQPARTMRTGARSAP